MTKPNTIAYEKVRVRSLQGDDEGETVTLSPKTLTVLRYYDLRSLPEVVQFSRAEKRFKNCQKFKDFKN